MTILSARTLQKSARGDPTLNNYLASMEEFVAEAKANPEKDYLLLQVLASHGYHSVGFQEVLGPYLNLETLQYEFIPVEKMVRRHFTGVPNAYCLVHFACCREIKKMSDEELQNIKKEFEEKLALAK